jgi:hypothetical protein
MNAGSSPGSHYGHFRTRGETSPLSIPAKAGAHLHYGHRPEFILGPAFGRNPWAGVVATSGEATQAIS